ncbi:MAG: hypothetical protein F4Y69_06370 [Chloroflexi bacterium]|nr:hypothetical protein [Chloroflexota bacterium]MYF21876.1 hypothetical protein [Chloroflexota bacterium]
MNEAELTLDGGLQIGFVQVGLDNGLSMAIPPLIQGTDDSLRWFGEAAIDSWEITAVDISPNQPSNLFDLLDASNWFPRAVGNPTRAVVTLAVDRGDEQVTQTILNDLQRNSAAPFDFEPLVDLPREHAGAREWPPISWVVTDTGLTLTLPEWSPEAIGWVAARVAESALSLESPPRHFSVRVTRIAPE